MYFAFLYPEIPVTKSKMTVRSNLSNYLSKYFVKYIMSSMHCQIQDDRHTGFCLNLVTAFHTMYFSCKNGTNVCDRQCCDDLTQNVFELQTCTLNRSSK